MTDVPARLLSVQPRALTVAEFNRHVRGTLEESFPDVWVEGEITSWKIAPSGHAYFDLKDPHEEARVSCCLFKHQLLRTRASVRDGERVVVHAKASLYSPRGAFQLIVDTVIPAGAGTAAAALEALKQKLAAEGLFAPERKRKLPRFPRAIGVVTSQAGAAFHDICRVIHRRWPSRIVLANTLVQGSEAPARIVAALEWIQRVPDVDVVIVGRGGGASDDLSAFNDERVARAIAACRVPVISAVGHEIDYTLADLVADVRASTPSNAAEMAVPERHVVSEELKNFEARLVHAVRARVDAQQVALARLEKRLGDPRRFTREIGQRLDEWMARITEVVRRRVNAERRRLDATYARLKGAHPRTRLARDRSNLENLSQRLAMAALRSIEVRRRTLDDVRGRLVPAMRAELSSYRTALATQAARLEALSPLAILARGYSVVLAHGRALTVANQVQPGETITVRLHRGEIDASVTVVRPES